MSVFAESEKNMWTHTKVFLSIMYPESENVSSPPSTAKIKNEWSHPSSRLLHSVVSKHMQNHNFELEEKKIWRKL
jgi:HD superfamily phosphohydrolase YqeK